MQGLFRSGSSFLPVWGCWGMLSFMIQGLQGGLGSGSPRCDSQGQGLEVFSITAAHILVVGNLLPLYRDAGKCLKCSCVS